MAENGVDLKSVELALLSEIENSSALQMKDAYLPQAGEDAGEGPGAERLQPGTAPHDDGGSGPGAMVYLTRIADRPPAEVTEKLLAKEPGRRTRAGDYDVYSLILVLCVRLADPSTTRFINGTIGIAFPQGVTILHYSPKEKGLISAIIEAGGAAISISPGLDMGASATKSPKKPHDPAENRFAIPVGPADTIAGSCGRTGCLLAVPAGFLLEYQGMLKNEREMFWEIYPPMPPLETEITGTEMYAVISLIVRAPKNSPPAITTRIEGRVKGNLWGVIPVKGSVVLE
jgi:hypothetical protein